MIKRVMKAASDSVCSIPNFFDYVRFPLAVSPKIDGVRAVTGEGVVLSKSMKRFPSAQVNFEFGEEGIPFLDGELVVGPCFDPGTFNRTASHVMSFDKPSDDLHLWVFDCVAPDKLMSSFDERYSHVLKLLEHASDMYRLVPHLMVRNMEELLHVEEQYLSVGAEGLMMRCPDSKYKQGRSTLSEGTFLKLKRYESGEGTVVDLLEGRCNNNPQKINEEGLSSRSSHSAMMEGSGAVGTFLVMFEGGVIKVAPGTFTKEQLHDFWCEPNSVLGKTLTFNFSRYGMKDAPRWARAKGLRDGIDS
jgi:DNA ligase-1